MEVTAMLKISELAMPKSRKVTTICNGRREVWNDYEEAKAYFLELMMSTDDEEHVRIYPTASRVGRVQRRRRIRKRASCQNRQLALSIIILSHFLVMQYPDGYLQVLFFQVSSVQQI